MQQLVLVGEDKNNFKLTSVMAVCYENMHWSGVWTMLLSSGFNFVCKCASQGSFPISCYNSSQRILFL